MSGGDRVVGVWVRLVCSVLALTVVVQLVPGVPGLPVGTEAAAAQVVDPEPAPAAVDPDPYLRVVEASGPTEVSGTISTDTVWGPQGSPYVVGVTTVAAGVSLTLLPGTVVKMEANASVTVEGQILAVGTPDDRVVVTSIRDDSVMGDTNGDGDATAAAMGDWVQIGIGGGPISVFDYVDISYGGNDFEGCVTWGAINVVTESSRVVVANSRFVEVQTGVRISGGSAATQRGFAGVYNSHFVSGRCGVSVQNGARAEIVGNTFEASFIEWAMQAWTLGRMRFWFNTVDDAVEVMNVFGDAPTREEADVRFNAFMGGINPGPYLTQSPLVDWSGNWFGHDANVELPTCLDPQVAAESHPPIETAPSPECPSGQEEVVGYEHGVLPALSGSPQVLPGAAREAAAPRFGPINTYLGALTYQVEDLAIEDAGMRVTATRTYRSDKLPDGDAGQGWTSAFSESLSQTGGLATLSFSDGTALGFPFDPVAGYTPAPGVSAEFTTGAGETTVTTPGRTGYHFDANGELVRMTLGDEGHELTVQRDGGQVSRVVGESGRYLDYDRGAGRLDAVSDHTGRGVELSYTGDRLTGVAGVDGRTEAYTYDSAGRLTQVTTPAGRVKLAAAYQSDGRIAWLEQAGTGRATFAYDDASSIRTITLDDGTVVTQKYDWAGRLVTERAGGTGVHIVYDGEGRVVSRITGLPDLPMEGHGPPAPAVLYDRSGDPVLTVDPTGRYELTTFNDEHQPLVTTHRDGSTVSRDYDQAGHLISVTDPLEQEWTYTYNSRGQVTSRTDPLDRTRTLVYDSNGDLITTTDETGAATTFGYDDRGRRTSVTDPLGHQTNVEYTSWDEIRRVVRPRGGATSVVFDADRQPVSMTEPTGAITAYRYDTAGRLISITDDLGQVTSIAYDSLGRVVTVTDARGSEFSRTYTTEGWVASVTDPEGRTTSVERDPSGREVRVSDPLGQVSQIGYDRAGRVTRRWSPDGALWRFTYDGMGRHATTRTPRNKLWEFTYDPLGRLTGTTDPADYQTSTAYDPVGRTVETADQEGVVTTYTHDDAQRTVTITDPLGVMAVEQRDPAGQVISRTDGSGVTTTYTYDPDGNLTEVTDPAGTIAAEYDLAGRVTAETDATGRRTTADYDPLGRPTGLVHPDSSVESFGYDSIGNLASHIDQAGEQWTYTYDRTSLLLTETDPLGGQTTYTYDALGRRTSVTDPAGVVENTAYDPVGRPAVRWDASGGSWVTRYDLDGNVVEEIAPDGLGVEHTVDDRGLRTETVWGSVLNEFTYDYDGLGRLVAKGDPYQTTRTYDERGRVATISDAEDNTTTYNYDGAGRQTSETLPSGRETTWAYDPAGRLATATDGIGNTSSYAYDADGRLSTITLPRGGQFDYTYDAAGYLASETDPVGEATSYEYDPAGRLTRTTYPSGRMVDSTYDAAGRPTSTTAGGVTRQFGYDPAGRLTFATVGASTLTYEYDDRGLLERQTGVDGDMTYAYDLVGRLTSRTPPHGAATTFSYDDTRGLLDSVDGPIEAYYTHNNAGQITRIAASSLSSTQPETRTYDSNGRLTSVSAGSQYSDDATYTVDGQVASTTRWVPGTTSRHTTEYTYDDAGRLDTAATSDGSTVISTTDYDWDADGNRSSVAVSGEPTVTATFDAANRLTATSDGTTYTYDDDGYLTGLSDGTSYAYNPFGESTGITTPTESVTYTRDALGRIESRDTGSLGQAYAYDGTSSTITGSLSTDQTYTQVIRDNAGLTLGEAIIDGVTRWARYNVHGDISRFHNQRCSLFGACGPGTTVVWAAGYDAFGEATVTTGAPPPVSLGFQAMFTEPLTGVVDMGARTYDPSTGRFTQPDTVIGALTTPISLNRYLYAHADPLSMFDPDGRWPFSLSGLIDAAIGFVDQATDAFHHLASAAGQVAAGLASDLSQLSDRARQAVDSAGESLASLAAQTAAGISEYWDRHGDQVTDTLTGVAVGAAIGGGCIALGIATAGIGGAVCAGAALGAVIGAAMCDDDRTAIGCAATGAIAGGVAGLTGGLAASAGAGGFTVGALSGLTGDATEQLLSTGTIDTRRLAAAALTGGALGWLGGRLANRSGLTLTSRGFGVSSGYRPVVVRPPSSPQVRPLARTRTCQHSFDPETEVLMADGTTRQIQHVRVGDKVIATDPETGRTSVEEVTATHANEDRDLTNLTVEDGDGNRSVVSTTWTHPFWSEDRERWVNASQLVPGERLRTAETGDSAFVVSTDNHVGDEAMRDLTVADTHTYHVMASDTPVLVHNCHGAYDWEPANRPGLATEPQGRLPEGSWIRPGEALTPGGSYHYVVMRNGSLRAMEEEAMWAIDDSAGHTSLAGNQPVHMAGMFEVDELGRIAMFDNWSGHYGPRNMPAYTPLEDIARAAFQKHRLPAPGPNSWELKSFW